MNGLVLAKTSPRNIKKILHDLDNFNAQIDKECRDGIAFAYEYADEIHEDIANNTVVMIRNPNPKGFTPTNPSTNLAQEKCKLKKASSTIILTALTLLPETISVIKD